ncbi:hypothetical protein ACP275_02G005400 [Erythranthe tilingii]
MAKALPSFQLHIEPTISQYQTFAAKTQTSKKTPKNEPRIQNQNSRSRRKSVNLRELRSYENSVSSTRKLLALVNAGSLENALHMFDTMIKSSTFVWNVIIRGLVDSGLFEKAIEFYLRMQFEGIKPDKFTFPFVIKACAGVFCLNAGRNVHSIIIKLGLNLDIYICNALIIMYAKVGCIEDSEKIFERMLIRDIVSWNSMISGYVSSGNGWESLMCFRRMQKLGVEIDRFSYISAFNACALEGCLLNGKEIFSHVLKNGVELDSMIQSSIIDMFGKSGEVDYAERFCNGISHKNVVVWNAMIGAYALNEKSFESFSCLEKMQDVDNLVPDTVTLINLLPSCSKLGALLQSKAIHGYAIRKGYLLSHLVLETALIDMYGKCGSIDFGERVFFHMKKRNLVSWNAMIAAYVQNSMDKEAIETFQKLQYETYYVPDEMTFASILSAYAGIALPKEGKQIHCHISKSGFSSGTFISNAMINMYAKCGDLDSARRIFDNVLCEGKDVISWNTIIMAYAIHGFGEYCFGLFSDMKNEGYEPNESTFVSILSACSIAGIFEQGWNYFDLMKNYYGLDPEIEHYGCMLDLLGRVGDFEKAKIFIEEMPLAPTHRIWGSLLSASRHHKNIEMAEVAAEGIFSLNNDNAGCYVLLSNMYAEVGRWEDVERVRLLMKKRGLVRIKECSIIECNGKTHKFRNYEKSENGIEFVYDVHGVVSRSIGEDLYFCGDTKFKVASLLKTRENSPMWHSVRLAICFGLIRTSIGEPLIIRKNVRICDDCHSAAKKISLVTGREIFIGDSKMYHCFKDGRCSCGDYW